MKLAEVSQLTKETDLTIEQYISELVATIGQENLRPMSAQELEGQIRHELTNASLYGFSSVALILLAVADLKYAQLNPQFWDNKTLNGMLMVGDAVALLGGIRFIINGIKTAKRVEEWEKQLEELQYFKLQPSDKV